MDWLKTHLPHFLTYFIVNTALYGIVFLLARRFIEEWIGRSVQHRYDRLLEDQRASNEKELTQFRNVLDTQRDLVSSAFLEARRPVAEKRLAAIQRLWDAMIEINVGAHPAVGLTNLAIDTEMYQVICAKADIPDLVTMGRQYVESDRDHEAEKGRLLSGEYLYALFYTYRAFIGSIALKLSIDRQKADYQPWWEYDHVLSLLKPALDEEEWKEFQALTIKRYSWVVSKLEGKFLKASEDILEGSRAATYASEQATAMIAAAKSKDQTI